MEDDKKRGNGEFDDLRKDEQYKGRGGKHPEGARCEPLAPGIPKDKVRNINY